MNPGPHIRRNSDILAADVADETVLLDPSGWVYISCNETAARIWQSLDRPRTHDEVVDSLLSDYDVDRATCAREVGEFVREMAGRGLIVVEAAA